MRNLTLFALALVLGVVAVACGNDAQSSGPPITATVLVEPSPDEAQWFRDVSVPEGSNAYELLVEAVDGELESQWHAEFQSHFVQSVLGEGPEGSEFWGAFQWNDGTGAWQPLSMGADLFPVEDGHVLGWALVEFDAESPQVPTSTP